MRLGVPKMGPLHIHNLCLPNFPQAFVYVVQAFRFCLRLHAPSSVISDDSLRRFFFIPGGSTNAAIPCLRWETGRNGTRVNRMTRELSENTDGCSNLQRKAAEMVAV